MLALGPHLLMLPRLMKDPAHALSAFLVQADLSAPKWHTTNCPDNNAGDCTCGYHAYRDARSALIRSFEEDQPDRLRKLIIAELCHGNLKDDNEFAKTQWSVPGTAILAIVRTIHKRYSVPMVLDKEDLLAILSRMQNWKMKQAYTKALAAHGFPSDVLVMLKDMAEQYEDCGWQEGKAFDTLREANDKMADMLGYFWNEEGMPKEKETATQKT